jgi:hypothetical protein
VDKEVLFNSNDEPVEIEVQRNIKPNTDDLVKVAPGQKPKAMIVVPTVHAVGYYTLFWMMRQGPRIAVRPFLHKRTGFVEDMRQKVCNLFIESNIEWLLMVDSDTIPSFLAERAIARAESVGAKVVAYPTPFIGSYPGIASNLFVAANDPNGEMDENGNPKMVLGGVPWFDLPWDQVDEYGNKMMFEIASAGFGCTLIHRDILVTLMESAEKGELTQYPFQAIYQKGELFYGEDQAFFLRAQGVTGLPIYADLDCWCSHHKMVLINPNVAADYLRQGKNAPNPFVNPSAPYNPELNPPVSTSKVASSPGASVLQADGRPFGPQEPSKIIIP